MNEMTGVKEKILDSAKTIAAENGIAHISIRTVAANCGVAVGTVYNYFPTKGDLIATVVENFWGNVFKDMDFALLDKLPPVSAIEVFYLQLLNYLSQFKVNWIEQLSLLGTSEKQIGKAKEKEMFHRIIAFIGKIITKSETVAKEYSDTEIQRLALFIFDNMIAMLRRGDPDFTFAKKLLTKLLGE